MNICKNCAFWEAHKNKLTGTCDKVEINEHGDKNINTDVSFYILFGVSDDSGLDMRLVTGANFGCLLYEETRSTSLI